MCGLIFSNGLVGHAWHGGRTVTSNAKNPIHKDSHKRARIVDLLQDLPLSKNAHFHAMGHTHQLHVQPPIAFTIEYYNEEKERLETTKALDPVTKDPKRGYPIVPLYRKWFINTGSLYRAYALGVTTYSEKAGYPPHDIGYAELYIDGPEITKIKKVYPRRDKKDHVEVISLPSEE